ncbi:MAG: hypothetical protein IKS52_04370 [Clostridia bacterium]|nr:hypothetical protein [Clostridia bacterium]MBO4884097.1 hypothetical protein [Clostridia bacterium]MBR4442488.1 hypothetical protein [Clostridia bacterium]
MQNKLIRIDPSRSIGRIKPMHGVGGGPVSGHFTHDATEEFRAAGIPFGRTHDIEYPFGSGEFVDIHCIFPFFDADENDPASYNFTLTDEYLRLMRAAGTEPFYRLGSSIEHQPIKRHIYPPKDFGKFARICSHIIAHYNEGWANGYEWNIRYWEIWNEPDIPQCWAGTQEEIFELYRVTASLIKREHPAVKVGGLALTSPHSSLFEPFLAFAREKGAPLDFVSWHGYCHKPDEAVAMARLARGLMDKYGFAQAESIYDEWNYVVRWDDLPSSVSLHRTAFGAAFMASLISSMQAESVDKLMFYDAQIFFQNWNNLFKPREAKVHAAMCGVETLKGYWTLYAWNELYKAGEAVACDAPEDMYCTAAKTQESDTLVYIAYYNDDACLNACPPPEAAVRFEIGGKPVSGMTLRRVDDGHDFEEEAVSGDGFTMQGNSFALVRIKK